MGLWSATRSESFLAVLLSTPLLTVDLVNEFTLVPLEETKIRYPSLHGNAGLSGILCIYIYTCVCARARRHACSCTGLYFYNLSGAARTGVLVGGGGGVMVAVSLGLTHFC